MSEPPECAICLNPLATQELASLHMGGKRACRHYIHRRCAQGLKRSRRTRCPLCREHFDDIQVLPSLQTDPQRWYHAVDFSGDGTLSRQEILDALGATLLLDQQALENFVQENFQAWDTTKSGSITEAEFLAPRGMVAQVLLTLGELSYGGKVPKLHKDEAAWFYHFAGERGYLKREDLVRGAMQSVPQTERVDAAALKAAITECVEGTVAEGGEVTLEAFLKERGPKDALLAVLPGIEELEERSDFSIPFNETTARVISGVFISEILVGSRHGNITYGQNPPAQWDTWEVDFESEAGPYEIWFNGGGNPHHGIVTVWIDGDLVGHINQYELYTTYPTRQMMRWGGGRSGTHTLRGSVESKEDGKSWGYWFCLYEINFEPVVPDAEAGS